MSALTSFGNLSAAYEASHPVSSEISSCLPNPVEQKPVDILEGYADGKLLNCFHCTVMVHIHRILHFHTLHFLSVETKFLVLDCVSIRSSSCPLIEALGYFNKIRGDLV